MRRINDVTTYIVEYMTEASEVREYTNASGYQNLLDADRNGIIRILNHTEVNQSTTEA